MAEVFEIFTMWFMGLGEKYGVNPIIFGSIYVGAIPFFTLSLAWIIKSYGSKKSIVLPALSATFFFTSSYIYLIIAGQNVPLWIYGFVIVMVGYGAYSTYKKVRVRIEKDETKPSFRLR